MAGSASSGVFDRAERAMPQAGARPDGGGAPRGDGLELFATCPKGFERLLAGELSGLGVASPRPLRGQVSFSGNLEEALRVCLWSRLASRVMLVLAHADAADSDALYESIATLPWEDHLSLSATFAIDAHGTNDNLRNTQFVALRAKDAICDRMQAKLGGRPNVDARNPDVSVAVRLRAERATIAIDLSGSPLFRRGATRRTSSDGLGGIRPDYAAALLATGGWHRCCRRDRPTLASVFSGSGTVLVEAAGIALDRARRSPGALGLRALAGLRARHLGVAARRGRRARGARGRAGGVARARGARPALGRGRGGAAGPARLGHRPRARLHAQRRRARVRPCRRVRGRLPHDRRPQLACQGRAGTRGGGPGHRGRGHGIPTGRHPHRHAQRGHLARGRARACRGVLVGRDPATLARYVAADATAAQDAAGPDTTAGTASPQATAAVARHSVTLKDGTTVPVLVAASDQFAARLAKVARLRAKWARRSDVSCYRVYDADLPDYAVVLDLYQASTASRGRDAGARWLVVQEYAAPRDIDPELAHRRLLDVLAIAPRVLGVAPGDVTLRVRRRAKGGSQYADAGEAPLARGGRRPGWLDLAPGAHLVDEGGLVFEVNLAERLDTGLFLDHRDVRAEVREMAKRTVGSKRFLNLFAYTGTATCYAADGGAKYTTTVDLSRTYLDWARRNMARNGFTGRGHEFVQADVVAWVSEQRHTPNRWDLVFCDPPTFSNSKRMGRDVFDVQHDHAELLIGISRLLTRNGVCLFSCNLRGFAPDVEKLARAGVQIEDVTAGTIPEDFSRNAKIHHCYLVRRTPRE